MQTLIEKSQKKIARIKMDFVRNYISNFNWGTQLIGVRGVRRIGKTILLLQCIKQHLLCQMQGLSFREYLNLKLG